MSHEIDITMQCQKWKKTIPEIELITQKTVNHVLKQIIPKRKNAEISIVLSDDAFIQNLNKTYRGKNKPTNVLSFPLTTKADLKKKGFLSLGDLIISYQTIIAESQDQNKAVVDHFQHMLVHGSLHLLHFDHETEAEAKTMEKLEISILKEMGIKNPYEFG